MAMKIGYIMVYDLEMNPHLTEKFKFREATFTRRITSKGDRVYSKMLLFPVDYEEIVDNANIMKKNPQIILTREPFLLYRRNSAKAARELYLQGRRGLWQCHRGRKTDCVLL